jgi:DNA-3-methyladenine glycosylase
LSDDRLDRPDRLNAPNASRARRVPALAVPPAERLPREFYARDALVVARALIGTYLVHGERVARIVETEAYRGPKDLACHARAGLTRRTRTLFGPPGHAYVFLVYGMHECFNVVCLGEGKGHAVLVRAVEPVRGIDEGARTDGPGRLSRALGLTRAHDAADLVEGGALTLAPRITRPRVEVSARVGVAYAGAIAEAPWRFFDASSGHVSRPSPRAIGLGSGVARRA